MCTLEHKAQTNKTLTLLVTTENSSNINLLKLQWLGTTSSGLRYEYRRFLFKHISGGIGRFDSSDSLTILYCYNINFTDTLGHAESSFYNYSKLELHFRRFPFSHYCVPALLSHLLTLEWIILHVHTNAICADSVLFIESTF